MASGQYKNGARHDSFERAELALLKDIPGCQSYNVPVGNDGAFIHTIELELCNSSKESLVCLLGYGLGAGVGSLLLSSFSKIASRDPTVIPFKKIYVLDWPGTGLSSAFHADSLPLEGGEYSNADASFSSRVNASVLEREPAAGDLDKLLLYFCHSLEQWRLAAGIQSMTLVGHSLGGYLAFSYCEWRYELELSRKEPAAVVTHLILASPCGLPARPDFRAVPLSQEAWREKRADEYAARLRPIQEFDADSRNRKRMTAFQNWRLKPLLCILSPCLLPCCALGWSFKRLCCSRRQRGTENAHTLNTPICKIMSRAPGGRVLGLLLRVGMGIRLENNGQWQRGTRQRLATYLRHFMSRNTGHAGASGSAAFSEHLFHCLCWEMSYSSFGWARAPLGGCCREEPLEDISFFGDNAPRTHAGGKRSTDTVGSYVGKSDPQPPVLGQSSAATVPQQETLTAAGYSDGRMQRLLRSRDKENSRDRARMSFIYGVEDWMDCRYAADVRKETVSSGGRVDICIVSCSGHQLPLDHPEGLAMAILRLSVAADGSSNS